MKLLILSDIHGNLQVLHAIRELYDELWVLGDIVKLWTRAERSLRSREGHGVRSSSKVTMITPLGTVMICVECAFPRGRRGNAPFYLQSIERFSKGLSSKSASQGAG